MFESATSPILQGTKNLQITGPIYYPFAISMASVAMPTGSSQAAVQSQTVNTLDLGLGNASVANIGAVTRSVFPYGAPANLGGLPFLISDAQNQLWGQPSHPEETGGGQPARLFH